MSKSAGCYTLVGENIAIPVKYDTGSVLESVRKVYRKEKPLAAAGTEDSSVPQSSHRLSYHAFAWKKRKLLTARRKEIYEFVLILYTDGPTNKQRILERFPPRKDRIAEKIPRPAYDTVPQRRINKTLKYLSSFKQYPQFCVCCLTYNHGMVLST